MSKTSPLVWGVGGTAVGRKQLYASQAKREREGGASDAKGTACVKDRAFQETARRMAWLGCGVHRSEANPEG